jgi:hypothetical protein
MLTCTGRMAPDESDKRNDLRVTRNAMMLRVPSRLPRSCVTKSALPETAFHDEPRIVVDAVIRAAPAAGDPAWATVVPRPVGVATQNRPAA